MLGTEKPDVTTRTALSHAVRSLRDELRETQQEFAARIGLSIGSIARYETNARPRRRILRTFEALAESKGLTRLRDIFNAEASKQPSLISRDTFQDLACFLDSIRNPVDVDVDPHDAIKTLRERLALSQQSFATQHGISMSGLANYERDRLPPIELLVKFTVIARDSGFHDLACTLFLSVKQQLVAAL